MSDIKSNKATDADRNVVVEPGVVKNFVKIVDVLGNEHKRKRRRRGPALSIYPEG